MGPRRPRNGGLQPTVRGEAEGAAREAGGSIDVVGQKIIEELRIDGRRSYAAIARRVGLSEAATRERVQRLLDEGTIRVVAITDAASAGFHRAALVGVGTEGDTHKVAALVSEIPEAAHVAICAGRYDLVVELVCADDDHLLEVVDRSVRAVPGVTTTETFVYLKTVKENDQWRTR